VLVIVPTLVAFPLQRFIDNGLTSGATT